MADLSEQWRAVLDAVRSGPVAWRSPAEVADALGWNVDQTSDELASMDVAGWVDIWEQDDGLVVTLSALAAEALGVRLVEVGSSESLRWVGRGEPEPPRPRARGVCQGARGADFEFLLDPHPTPDVLAEAADEPIAAASDPEAAAPRPTLLVGVGLVPWPGPARGVEAPCPACGSAHLDADAYCIRCDRWGRDATRSAPARSAADPTGPPRPARSSTREEREARRRSERARRKQRRRCRMAARLTGRPASAGVG